MGQHLIEGEWRTQDQWFVFALLRIMLASFDADGNHSCKPTQSPDSESLCVSRTFMLDARDPFKG
jgi:hypothetical protein